MIVTVESHAPCRLFDANGTDLTPQLVVWADTETGEYVRIACDQHGRPEFVKGEHGGLEVRREWRQAPSPLSVVRTEAAR